MTEPQETPREAAQEPAGAAPRRNGNAPIDQELKLARSVLEEIDMKLTGVQFACMLIVGLSLLTLALEVKELRG